MTESSFEDRKVCTLVERRQCYICQREVTFAMAVVSELEECAVPHLFDF